MLSIDGLGVAAEELSGFRHRSAGSLYRHRPTLGLKPVGSLWVGTALQPPLAQVSECSHARVLEHLTQCCVLFLLSWLSWCRQCVHSANSAKLVVFVACRFGLNPLGHGIKRSQGITQELHDAIQQIFDSSNSMPRVVLIGQSSVPPGSEPHDVDTEARSNAVLRLYSEAAKTTQLPDSTDNQIHMNTSEEGWTQSALSHTQSKGTRGGYICISREQLECDARRTI